MLLWCKKISKEYENYNPTDNNLSYTLNPKQTVHEPITSYKTSIKYNFIHVAIDHLLRFKIRMV